KPHAAFARNAILHLINCLDLEVSQIKARGDPELHFVGLHIGEGSLNRLLHRPVDSSGELQLARPCSASNLKAVQSDPTLIVHRRGINGSSLQWVTRDNVPRTFFWETYEAFLSRSFIDIGERGLKELERPHFLQLLLHASPTLHR